MSNYSACFCQSCKTKDKRIEELKTDLAAANALMDRAIAVWHSSEGDDMNIVIKDMRKRGRNDVEDAS